MLACRRGIHGGLAMQVIGQAQRDHLNFLELEQLMIIREPPGNVMFLRKSLHVRLRRRGDGNDLRLRNTLECFRMKLGNELGTDDAHAYWIHAMPFANKSLMIYICGLPGRTSRLCFSASRIKSFTISG